MDLVRSIVDHTATVFGRTSAELLGRSRVQPIAEARQAAMWAVRRRYPSISLMDIGDAVGGRHYTTVMHAIAAVELRAARDPAYAERLERLLARLGAPAPPDSVQRRAPIARVEQWLRPASEDIQMR